MRFLKIKCYGAFNSFRQPDFHTYHKTLPLPPKTTVAGMIGSALGISPIEVNDQWLRADRFKMGVVGKHYGQANDLWQIRKYENKHLNKYKKGEEKRPYKTAVIVRELLYGLNLTLYLTFSDSADFDAIKSALSNPKWTLSLGREDELIRISSMNEVELKKKEKGLYIFKDTIIPGDVNELGYRPVLEDGVKGNLLQKAPRIVNLPSFFDTKKNSEARIPTKYQKFTFISSLPISLEEDCYYDDFDNQFFFIF